MTNNTRSRHLRAHDSCSDAPSRAPAAAPTKPAAVVVFCFPLHSAFREQWPRLIPTRLRGATRRQQQPAPLAAAAAEANDPSSLDTSFVAALKACALRRAAQPARSPASPRTGSPGVVARDERELCSERLPAAVRENQAGSVSPSTLGRRHSSPRALLSVLLPSSCRRRLDSKMATRQSGCEWKLMSARFSDSMRSRRESKSCAEGERRPRHPARPKYQTALAQAAATATAWGGGGPRAPSCGPRCQSSGTCAAGRRRSPAPATCGGQRS